MSSCPTDHDLNRYHAGELDQARAEEVRAHLAACAACGERDSSIVAEHEDLVQCIRSLGLANDLTESRRSSGSRTVSKQPAAKRVEADAAPPAHDDGLDVGARPLPP